ncbi:Dol-P-Man:Man(5)GlcNAc(2)-PP-Dol alpha-1,3-mannosyltransferase [Morella rubra]|uniref:dolichyl-P-Man:Man5GlcNAc2-PP-dolichol alpha-1,3-mannosyltransferase n=1 Tax=Morella rubra TaxID=262757 RepID=A0A6A1URL2_9ROSI|nr:Dol-P-Man:Man(5)GlcNAc(2)-PP-Dol alpha-1,3-mannosyltransferase [Morella rubra]
MAVRSAPREKPLRRSTAPASKLSRNPKVPFALALIFADAILVALIIAYIPYTKIDWDAYMSQVSGFLGGERDYSKLEGDTGPLVYPAGFLYIYSAIQYVTGGEIYPAQILFSLLYIINLAIVLFIYTKTDVVPWWALVLLCLSKRVHSIFVLRLFNDCFAMMLLHAALVSLLYKRWHLGLIIFRYIMASVLHIGFNAENLNIAKQCRLDNEFSYHYAVRVTFSLWRSLVCTYLPNEVHWGCLLSYHTQWLTYPDPSILGVSSSTDLCSFSVKMNVLLYAPPLFLLMLKAMDICGVILALACAALVQILLGLPFIISHPMAYISRSFNLGRVFIHFWSVNFKFLPEPLFVSKELAVTLLVAHLVLLAAFAHYKWCKHEGGLLNFVHSRFVSLKKSVYSTSSFQELNKEYIVTAMFVGNFIGIVCARSLHYQFYSWYFYSLPYLLWRTPFPTLLRGGNMLECLSFKCILIYTASVSPLGYTMGSMVWPV